MGTYTVERVERGNTFTTEHGQFQSWKLGIFDGENHLEADMNTKAGKEGPSIGERIEGELTKGQYGWRLKRSYGGGGNNSAGGNWKPRDPKETAQIVRQHSQQSAIQWCAILDKKGRLPDDIGPQYIKRLIDFFDQDVYEAGENP